MGMTAEPEFHVLAVDDSLIDRKLIERLLKNSSYQGIILLGNRVFLSFLFSKNRKPIWRKQRSFFLFLLNGQFPNVTIYVTWRLTYVEKTQLTMVYSAKGFFVLFCPAKTEN